MSSYGYKDSKELFNTIKNSRIKFREAKNKQNNFLKKLNEVKMGNKTIEQRETINNLINLKKRLLTFLETILKRYLMQITMQEKIKLKEKGLKY